MGRETFVWYPPAVYAYTVPEYYTYPVPEFVEIRPKIMGPYGPYRYGPY